MFEFLNNITKTLSNIVFIIDVSTDFLYEYVCFLINQNYIESIVYSIKIKLHETETVDKTITTVYDKRFQIKDLLEQIKELYQYQI